MRLSEVDDRYAHLDSGQAYRVILKFGGVGKLLKALRNVGCDYAKSSVYRWIMPRTAPGKGTGGFIPQRALKDVLEAARIEGLIITSEDLDPRRFPVSATSTDYFKGAAKRVWQKNRYRV